MLLLKDPTALAGSRLARTWTSNEWRRYLHQAVCPAGGEEEQQMRGMER